MDDEEKFISVWEEVWDYFGKWYVLFVVIFLIFILVYIGLFLCKSRIGLDFWGVCFFFLFIELIFVVIVVI